MHVGFVAFRKTLPFITFWFVLLASLTTVSAEQHGAQGSAPWTRVEKDDASSKTDALKEAIGQERERVRQRIEMIRMWSLITELELDEEKAKALFPIISEFRQKRYTLAVEIHQVKLQLAAAMARTGSEESEFQGLIQRYRKLMNDYSGLALQEFDRMSAVLNPRQQSKYILFGDRFNRELQVIIHQVMNQDSSKASPPAAEQPSSPASEKTENPE